MRFGATFVSVLFPSRCVRFLSTGVRVFAVVWWPSPDTAGFRSGGSSVEGEMRALEGGATPGSLPIREERASFSCVWAC